MEKHTHREFVVWMRWLDEEWNRPEPSDYYLMQIAAEIRRVLSKKPRHIKMEDFKLEFAEAEHAPAATVEEAAARSKSKWKAIVGLS